MATATLKTKLQNLKTDLEIRAQVLNASLQTKSDAVRRMPAFSIAFGLGFAFMLMALGGIAVPVQAATLNESIAPILSSVTELFTPLLALIVAAVPLIIAISVIGFITGILAAILTRLHI